MGIENEVRRRYGDRYWEKYKKKILAQADSNGDLEKELAPYNARIRRAMFRHPERFNATQLKDAGVWDLPEFWAARRRRLEDG